MHISINILERDNAGLIADNTKVFKINKQHKKKIAELGKCYFGTYLKTSTEKIIANQKDELLKKEGAIEALTGVAKFSRKLESEPERRVFLVNNNE